MKRYTSKRNATYQNWVITVHNDDEEDEEKPKVYTLAARYLRWAGHTAPRHPTWEHGFDPDPLGSPEGSPFDHAEKRHARRMAYAALRNITLAILLDHYDENEEDLPYTKERILEETRAWTLHVPFTQQLFGLTDARAWEITSPQIQDWIDDWTLQRHTKHAHARYGYSYPRDPFDLWCERLALQQYAMQPTPHQTWCAYLNGYQPYHFLFLLLWKPEPPPPPPPPPTPYVENIPF